MLRLMICFLICFSMLSCSSKDDKTVSGNKIEAAIKNGDDIYFEDNTITGDLNLIDLDKAVKTSPSQSTMYIKSALVFKNCTFKGQIIGSMKDNAHTAYTTTFFKNLYFDNCTFEDDVNMEGANINGFCNFLNCTFKKNSLFNRVTFNQTVAFTKCIFQQTAGFQSCTFLNSAFYNEAHFNQACFFQNSFFYREFTFNVVVSDGYTDFSSTVFYSNIFCNYAKFNKAVVFSNASLKGRTEFVGSKFVTSEFDGTLFYGPAIFEKSVFAESLSLKGAQFLLEKPRTAGYTAGKIDITGAQVIETPAIPGF